MRTSTDRNTGYSDRPEPLPEPPQCWWCDTGKDVRQCQGVEDFLNGRTVQCSTEVCLKHSVRCSGCDKIFCDAKKHAVVRAEARAEANSKYYCDDCEMPEEEL